jgi:hypothetical protein
VRLLDSVRYVRRYRLPAFRARLFFSAHHPQAGQGGRRDSRGGTAFQHTAANAEHGFRQRRQRQAVSYRYGRATTISAVVVH